MMKSSLAKKRFSLLGKPTPNADAVVCATFSRLDRCGSAPNTALRSLEGLDTMSRLSTEKEAAPSLLSATTAVPSIAEGCPYGVAPPVYTAVDNHESSAGPSMADFVGNFANLKIEAGLLDFPTNDLALAHLKVLEAFFSLKGEVGYTDGVFELWDSRAPGTAESIAGDEVATRTRLEALSKIREKRWALYVARAVDRFETWWMGYLSKLEPDAVMMKDTDMGLRGYTHWPRSGKLQHWRPEMLPPLDVLMVWHSFMLNPRNYLEDCIRFGLRDLWSTGFPWAAINYCISTSFNYEVPEAAKENWTRSTGRAWDNIDDVDIKHIMCPRCSAGCDIPWTTCGLPENNIDTWQRGLFGKGFGEADFSFYCQSCGGEINHDALRVAKFKKDAEMLLLRDWPMGGTILHGKSGVPRSIPDTDWNSFGGTFPNRLVKRELRTKIVELLPRYAGRGYNSMTDVRSMIETAISNPDVVRKINRKLATGRGGKCTPEDRLAIRKMMARYWDNSKPFSMDLGGAVIRQGTFIDKMHGLDWLHSPTATTTMSRLLLKYDRFFRIMATNPAQTAVPTLDVDLAWHTHQLSPHAYFAHSISHTGGQRFIDHDDKIEESNLADGFEWTSRMYEKNYNAVYSECTCWYCEAIRVKHVSSVSRFVGASKHDKITDEFYNSGAANFCPPAKSAHISSHNAVPTDNSKTSLQIRETFRAVREAELEEAYQKACKRAAKKGRPMPRKEQYSQEYWGYHYPYYYPYMGAYLWMTPGLYYYPMYIPCEAPVLEREGVEGLGGAVEVAEALRVVVEVEEVADVVEDVEDVEALKISLT
ncbi:hypothetical protein ACEPPN_019542 [Leptodophora sp. 'Broadleaf-Isolate-01']